MPSKPKPFLTVQRSIWEGLIMFTDRQGKQHLIDHYQTARDYAASNGYAGIRVQHGPAKLDK